MWKIREKFVSNLPSPENEMFPHPASAFTRDHIASKVQQTRVKYRKTLDTGQQSRGDRIVATFLDICNEIWSGSPATESIESG